MSSPWQLWECILARALVQLAQYQWETYGTKLNISTGAQEQNTPYFVEPLEEIDRLMRQAPSRSHD